MRDARKFGQETRFGCDSVNVDSSPTVARKQLPIHMDRALEDMASGLSTTHSETNNPVVSRVFPLCPLPLILLIIPLVVPSASYFFFPLTPKLGLGLASHAKKN